jgi:hypothetical protein
MNIILELNREIARVRALFPKFNQAKLAEAHRAVEWARTSLARNSYAEMREAIDDLRDFKDPEAK